MKFRVLKQPPGQTIKTLWKKTGIQYKYAFSATFILGMLVHLFVFTGVYLNHDGFGQLAMSLDGLYSGRWFQRAITDLSGPINAPYIIGLLSMLYLSLGSVMIVDMFNIRSRLYITLLSACLVTFSSLGVAYAFIYTADANAGCFALAIAGAWFIRRFSFGWIPGCLCLALSMGIYQSYICTAAALLVLALMMDLTRPEETFKTALLKGIRYLLVLAASGGVYFGVLKLALMSTGTELTDYQGINNLGSFSLSPALIKDAYINFFLHFKNQGYYFLPKTMPWVYLFILLAAVFLLLVLVVRSKLYRRPLPFVLFLVLTALFPLAANATYVLTGVGAGVYALMLFPLVTALVLCVVLLHAVDTAFRMKQVNPAQDALGTAESARRSDRLRIPVVLVCWLQILLLCLVCYNGFLNVNSSYLKAKVGNDQALAYSMDFSRAVEETPGYQPEMWIYRVGDSPEESTVPLLNEQHLFGFRSSWQIINSHAYGSFLRLYTGKPFNVVGFPDDSFLEGVREEVEAMPVYPAPGSTRVLNDILYVKMGEIT